MHLRERRARVVADVFRREPRDGVRVDLAVGGDRADRVLGVPRRPDLGGNDDIERKLELARDLGRHDHTAPRNPEHHSVARNAVRDELLGELTAGVRSVCEHGIRLLLQLVLASACTTGESTLYNGCEARPSREESVARHNEGGRWRLARTLP